MVFDVLDLNLPTVLDLVPQLLQELTFGLLHWLHVALLHSTSQRRGALATCQTVLAIVVVVPRLEVLALLSHVALVGLASWVSWLFLKHGVAHHRCLSIHTVARVLHWHGHVHH